MDAIDDERTGDAPITATEVVLMAGTIALIVILLLIVLAGV